MTSHKNKERMLSLQRINKIYGITVLDPDGNDRTPFSGIHHGVTFEGKKITSKTNEFSVDLSNKFGTFNITFIGSNGSGIEGCTSVAVKSSPSHQVIAWNLSITSSFVREGNKEADPRSTQYEITPEFDEFNFKTPSFQFVPGKSNKMPKPGVTKYHTASQKNPYNTGMKDVRLTSWSGYKEGIPKVGPFPIDEPYRTFLFRCATSVGRAPDNKLPRGCQTTGLSDLSGNTWELGNFGFSRIRHIEGAFTLQLNVRFNLLASEVSDERVSKYAELFSTERTIFLSVFPQNHGQLSYYRPQGDFLTC
ncbi:hypothetical protein T439DRAFT_334402 [Meredithblackwellia eburnea MCA 4105]